MQTFIKLENEVEDLVAPTEVILDDPVVSFAAHPGKRTKIESLMQKYGAKFVNNEIGRGIKTPKVICPLCDKILTVTAFRVHMQRHEGTQELPFMCEICSKKFPSNAEFVVHKRSHTKEKVSSITKEVLKYLICFITAISMRSMPQQVLQLQEKPDRASPNVAFRHSEASNSQRVRDLRQKGD